MFTTIQGSPPKKFDLLVKVVSVHRQFRAVPPPPNWISKPILLAMIAFLLNRRAEAIRQDI